ncbi:STM3941 family protein [Flavobacterium gelatinilyticum]|uniref:STM3941 family protein n=1 Tax=Flavobacterium gelatinilyticum TaxID=3003260 RepID=UPI002480626B|nr:STM3941 family protein [Flavobacterium gelatinilyticum]
MDKIEIYSSKKKSFLLLIGSLLFVIGGIWMFMDAENLTGFRSRSPMLLKGIGIISVLFFGLGFCLAIKQLIKNKLFLIIDNYGINVDPKKNSSKIINWNNIKGFSEIKIQSQKMVLIKVNNPDFWIENETNLIRKKLTQYNLNEYGSPFCLSAISMEINHAELMKILNENLKKYKK